MSVPCLQQPRMESDSNVKAEFVPNFQQVRQQDAYPTNVGGAVKTVCNTPTLFKGNISIADCMSLSSLL